MERDRPQSEGEIRCIIKYISVNPSTETEYIAFIPFANCRVIIGENAWNRNGKLKNSAAENSQFLILLGKSSKNWELIRKIIDEH